jgi:hypothetical protein
MRVAGSEIGRSRVGKGARRALRWTCYVPAFANMDGQSVESAHGRAGTAALVSPYTPYLLRTTS